MFANISRYVLEHIFSAANLTTPSPAGRDELVAIDMTEKSETAR
jgi:hypothetical protein